MELGQVKHDLAEVGSLTQSLILEDGKTVVQQSVQQRLLLARLGTGKVLIDEAHRLA